MDAYLANDKYNATLSSGYTAGQNVLYVSAVPDNVPTIVVAAKGTENETVFEVTGKTVNSLTGVSRLRGANIDLDAQTPVTCLNNEEFVNQYSGAASSAPTVSDLIYATDGGSTDAYAISLDPAITEYTDGLLISFKANTTNTGASTLNVNSEGAKAIKKLHNQDLADGDIEAGQIVTVIYDADADVFQMQSQLAGITSTMTDAGGYVKPATDGDDIRSYDGDGDDYTEVLHDGTDSKINTNKGHIVLTPAASKLVKLATLRQDDTTNSYQTNQVILTGWGYISGTSSTSNQSETVNFGVTFASAPQVFISASGTKTIASGAPTAIGDFTTGLSAADTRYGIAKRSVTTTSFVAEIATYAGGNLTGYNYAYEWIAIGTLA